MHARKFRVPQRKTARRWRVPPALRRGDETFEGLGVLEEVCGREGLVLWQSLRDALLWAEAPAGERAGLFAARAVANRAALIAAADPELQEPLGVLARMLGDAESSEADVALACRALARHAEGRGLLGTALAFAQAAATVDASDAAAAFDVGSLARRRGEAARAETWLRRTVALARQSGDWATYAQAFLTLGRMDVERGKHAAARKHLDRAVRAAQRNSLHGVEGKGLHELCAVAIQEGGDDEVRELARAALDAYGPGAAELPRLARDVACWWIAAGRFNRALPLLRAVLPHLPDPAPRLALHGTIARAAGGVGDRDAFREAWDACFDLLHARAAREQGAAALLDVAHGAATLKLWDKADQAARQALEIAAEAGEAPVQLDAERLLDAVRHHRVEARRPAQPPVPAAADARLAAELVRALEREPAAP